MANPLQHPTYLHTLDDDVIDATQNRRPSVVRDHRQAKLILQETSGDSSTSVFDHLSVLIKRILDERPPNVVDYFEDFSRQVREEHFKMNDNQLQHTFIEPQRLQAARSILPMLTLPPPENFPNIDKGPAAEEATGEDDVYRDPLVTDVMHLQFYWSLLGFGFPKGEVFMLSCCLRKLEEKSIIANCRFWGQIFGIHKNYFIVEAELTTEEIDKRVAAELKEIEEKKQKIEQIKEADDLLKANTPDQLVPKRPDAPLVQGVNDQAKPPSKKIPPTAPLPHTMYQKKKDVPVEQSGTGLNRKTYFVCNRLGDEWLELPLVTPQQIVVSRQIKKFFTGDLNQEIWSYPKFPGVEKNYLRAMIARITASTYVSPIGYYRVGSGDDEEEEEADEEGADNDKVTAPDPGYEPINASELRKLQSWTHHRCHILQQGRINWFNLKDLEDKEEGEAEEEEEEEEEVKNEGEEPETGPNILTPCSEDVTEEQVDIWTTKFTQTFNPSNTMVLIRSNIWPGAFSFAYQRVHDSLYVGWGCKFVKRNYSPISIPPIENEYPIGPEVLEILDPTVEAEEAYRLAHEKKEILADAEEEEDEEEEEAGAEDDENEED